MTNDSTDRDAAETLFLAELATINRAIRFACFRAGLGVDEAEDFASHVRVKLIEDDYAVLRKYEERSTFAAFVSIVIQRLLLDYRVSQWGKWHASSRAQRLGDVAVTLEMMLHRDGRTIDEAFPALKRRWPALTREEVDRLAEQLPPRTRRPRPVSLELAGGALLSRADAVTAAAFASDRRALSRRIAEVVRSVIRDFADDDRLICRLRFEGGMSVAAISRALGIEQKPIYRRVRKCLLVLRKQLEREGICADDVENVLASRDTELDFGFGFPAPSNGRNTSPSDDEEGA